MAEVVQTTNTEKNYVLGFKCLERRKGKSLYYDSYPKEIQLLPEKKQNKKTTTKETKNKPKPNMKQITKSRKRTKWGTKLLGTKTGKIFIS